MTKRTGFIIGLVVIAFFILGALFVAYRFGGGRSPPKQWVAMGDLIGLGTQLQVFRERHGRHPTSQEGLDALVHRLSDAAIARTWLQQLKFIEPDPWGRPYQYRCPGRRTPQSFDLFSLGPDGVESSDDIYFSKHWQEEHALEKAWGDK